MACWGIQRKPVIFYSQKKRCIFNDKKPGKRLKSTIQGFGTIFAADLKDIQTFNPQVFPAVQYIICARNHDLALICLPNLHCSRIQNLWEEQGFCCLFFFCRSSFWKWASFQVLLIFLEIWQSTAKLWLGKEYALHISPPMGLRSPGHLKISKLRKNTHVLVQETKWNSSMVGGWTNPFWEIFGQKWVHLLPENSKKKNMGKHHLLLMVQESETTTLDV